MPDSEPRTIDPEFWRQMRAIMYQPTEVWLVSLSDSRWLTDQFVMLDITQSDDFAELEDGPYKLTVSKGPEAREGEITLDLAAYFEVMGKRHWVVAEPTEWSVFEEYPGKAHLWVADDAPVLMGEPTWVAIHRYHPHAIVEHAYGDKGGSVFRFLDMPGEHQLCLDAGEEVYCGHHPMVFAYAGGIKMPPGQDVVAVAIAEATTGLAPEALAA